MNAAWWLVRSTMRWPWLPGLLLVGGAHASAAEEPAFPVGPAPRLVMRGLPQDGPAPVPSQDPAANDPRAAALDEDSFFRVEDLQAGWRERLPFELNARADLTFLYFGDERNLDGFDEDKLLMLNPALRVKYDFTEQVFVVGEVEWDGEDRELETDELHLGYRFESVEGQLSAGINYVPFGIERYSYSPPANPLVDRPSPFRRIFPGTYSDIGLFWFSEHEVGEDRALKLEVALTRGLEGPRREDRAEDWLDHTDSPQLVGRVGFQPAHGVEFGVSGLGVRPTDRTTEEMWLAGVDASFEAGPYAVKAEAITGRVDQSGTGSDFGRRGWYVQLLRRIAVDQRWCRGLEVVFRFDSVDENDLVRDYHDVNRYAFGFNWWLRDDLRLKAEYSIADERHHEIANNGFLMQLGWHF